MRTEYSVKTENCLNENIIQRKKSCLKPGSVYSCLLWVTFAQIAKIQDQPVSKSDQSADITPPNQEEAFSSHRSNSIFSDSYGDWNHPLASSFFDGRRRRYWPWTFFKIGHWKIWPHEFMFYSGRFLAVLPVSTQARNMWSIFDLAIYLFIYCDCLE